MLACTTESALSLTEAGVREDAQKLHDLQMRGCILADGVGAILIFPHFMFFEQLSIS